MENATSGSFSKTLKTEVVSENSLSDGASAVKTYGLKVTRGAETVTVSDISSDRHAVCMFEMWIKHKNVGIAHIRDLVEDFFDLT